MVTPTQFSVKINNINFGVILDEVFADATQFRLFLTAVQGCIELKNDLTFFNGKDFLVHIPFSHLNESVITTSTKNDTIYSLSEHYKSKIEALEVRK